MGKSRPVVYLDTCAIIEAHRVKCWKQLASHYELHTVRKCCEELADGNPRDPDYIAVDLKAIAPDIMIHEISSPQCVKAAIKAPSFGGLDPGEKELLAWCADQDPKAMIITTGDRAAIVAACELWLRENLQPLEDIATTAGVRGSFKHHFCRVWLQTICSNFALDNF
jgi:hypothetical protein